MNTRFTQHASAPEVNFAPGDEVVRYCGGQPFFCTVIEIRPDDCLRVSCPLWPKGYSALVTAQEVAFVSHSGPGRMAGL